MLKSKKSFILIIVIITCIILAIACFTNKQEVVNIDEENNVIGTKSQLDLIFNNKNLWYKDTEFSDKGSLEIPV